MYNHVFLTNPLNQPIYTLLFLRERSHVVTLIKDNKKDELEREQKILGITSLKRQRLIAAIGEWHQESNKALAASFTGGNFFKRSRRSDKSGEINKTIFKA